MSHRCARTAVPGRRRAVAAGLAALVVVALPGCDAGSSAPAATEASGAAQAPQPAAAPSPQGSEVRTNVQPGARQVPVDRQVEVTAADGRLTDVTVSSPAGRVVGELDGSGSRWTATGRLEPGTA